MPRPLAIANEFLRDSSQLNARFHDDGYLFFRHVIDVAQVLRVKMDLVLSLARHHSGSSGSDSSSASKMLEFSGQPITSNSRGDE